MNILDFAYPLVLAFCILFEANEMRRALQGKPVRPPLASYAAMTEARRARYDPHKAGRLQAAACGVLALAFLLLLVSWLLPAAGAYLRWALVVLGAVYMFLHSEWALELAAAAPLNKAG